MYTVLKLINCLFSLNKLYNNKTNNVYRKLTPYEIRTYFSLVGNNKLRNLKND